LETMFFASSVTILGLLAVIASADVLSRTAEISFRAGSKANPLLKAAKNVHRLKRQAQKFNETFLELDMPTECIMKCMYAMDDKMEALFPSNITDDKDKKSKTENIMDEYDAVKFDQFCNIYRPASKCFNECPNGDMKNFTQNGMKMMEILCVTKNAEFKKNLPCMNKIGKDIEKVCGPKCEKYEHALDKLEKYEQSENSNEYDNDELRFLFSQGCKYVSCSEDCGHPMTEKACGKEAGDLETLLITQAFQSVNDLMSTFQGIDDLSLDFWPKECRDLGNSTTSS